MLKCYISHYTKLIDRKKYMDKQLQDIQLHKICSIRWLTEFDKEDITPEQMNKYISKHNNFNTNMSYWANAIAHINALEDLAKTDSDGLIIEDDIVFNKNFTTELIKILNNLPEDWDMIFLSEGCNIHQPNINPNINLYKYNRSRCASCYLVSNKAAKKLISTITPITKAIDHSYNDEIIKHLLNSYLLEPTIAIEGSDIGLFKSTV